jgi:hypothetical protein
MQGIARGLLAGLLVLLLGAASQTTITRATTETRPQFVSAEEAEFAGVNPAMAPVPAAAATPRPVAPCPPICTSPSQPSQPNRPTSPTNPCVGNWLTPPPGCGGSSNPAPSNPSPPNPCTAGNWLVPPPGCGGPSAQPPSDPCSPPLGVAAPPSCTQPQTAPSPPPRPSQPNTVPAPPQQLPPTQPAPQRSEPPIQPAPVSKLVVFVPGIDFPQSNDVKEPYDEVHKTFGPVLNAMRCSTGPPSEGVLVRCADGVAWIPYTYVGTGVPAGLLLAYQGFNTGQPLQRSSAILDSIVALARRQPGVGNATVYVVGHSLGGAIGAFWGAEHREATIITLDSPVAGIWNPYPENDIRTLTSYCDEGIGAPALSEVVPIFCNFALNLGRPALLQSDVVKDLRRNETIARNGRARAINFANAQDIGVPSWYALNPSSANVLKDVSCNPRAPVNSSNAINHGCIVDVAAEDVNVIIQKDSWESLKLHNQRAHYNLQVCVGLPSPEGFSPERATVEVRYLNGADEIRASRVEAVRDFDEPSPCVTIENTPWTDSLLTVSYRGETTSVGILPARNKDILARVDYPERVAEGSARPHSRRWEEIN